ncbi:B3 domain-containing protein [Raphanus sativus]|uniref:B3 domain-containing protein At3g25182-like n=1 Tax=Raphanus sativus TaxID=3726 RepID=A0A6J0N779_RAPSA|nr:B3 domain-containing protein At3g25182-like [Raphanus sativus]KAJ4904123.1 B3 domain-containing protein [Raphanus sativus]
MANGDVGMEELMPFKKRRSLRVVVELPVNVKEKIVEMGGTQETLITKRTLTTTDVDKGQSHLSIPMSSLLTHSFMTSDEKEKIENRVKGDKEGGLTVEVIDPKLKVWELKLRSNMKKTSSLYLLAYQWNHVVKHNDFKQGDELQLWSFRSQQKLCLALVLLQGEERL